MIGACMPAGRPLLTANTFEVNLTTRFLRLSDPWTMMPFRNAMTSGVPPPAASGWMNCRTVKRRVYRQLRSWFHCRLERSHVTTVGKLFTSVCLLSPSSIIRYRTGRWAVTFCGWEGNRRSVVALAMRYRISGLIICKLEVLKRKMKDKNSTCARE